MSRIHALVLTGYGLNCDQETVFAFEQAGAIAQRIHINTLIDNADLLKRFQVLAFIGGFSWGDDHGAGVVQAVRLKTRIGEELLRFIERGNLVIGICNGFQCLANLGLLPGIDHNYTARSVALTYNDCGNFRNDWVNLKSNSSSPCIFTSGLEYIELPIRHGEGKFVADRLTLDTLAKNNQIVLQYALPGGTPAHGMFPHNPNGSLDDIAGICDPSGRVFGLMPHPEAYNHYTNHPDWPARNDRIKRGAASDFPGSTPGIKIFQNCVDYFV